MKRKEDYMYKKVFKVRKIIDCIIHNYFAIKSNEWENEEIAAWYKMEYLKIVNI